MKPLRTVTDSFSLVEKVRKYTTQNGRSYVIRSVNDTFNDPKTKERIALGEMYGYFGHGRRAMNYERTKSLNVPEVSVVMVEGKPVVLDNVPSSRTLSVGVSDDGVVTHTQEILDTVPGQVVSGMIDSQAGGWSWATHGPDTALSIVKSFHGFDYVTIPNFISLNRERPMMESAEEEQAAIHRNMVAQGFSDSTAADLVEHFSKMKAYTATVETAERNMMLESALISRDAELEQLKHDMQVQLSEREQRDALSKAFRRTMRNTIDGMPVFLSDAQRRALFNLKTEDDARIVADMIDSLGRSAAGGLPLPNVADATNSVNNGKGKVPVRMY